jgi:uncharacterized protein YigE (DUF2233 family)
MFIIVVTTGFFVVKEQATVEDPCISYQVDLKKQTLQLYWKDEKGGLFKNFQNLKSWLDNKGEKLVFAMNGGMYKTDNAPLGLFVQNRKTITPLNKRNGDGNFYLKPNGVFFITTTNNAVICPTEKFVAADNILYATQSGPMLLVDGQINIAFKQGSINLNIRNAVGILPGNKILFAMSREGISLYDFADYFKKAGCKNALYLDGFVSRTYLPEKNWIQTDGNFGVLISVTSK